MKYIIVKNLTYSMIQRKGIGVYIATHKAIVFVISFISLIIYSFLSSKLLWRYIYYLVQSNICCTAAL